MNILITGASRGLGKALCEYLATEHTVAGLGGRGDCDITDPTALNKRLAGLEPDLLINVAGIAKLHVSLMQSVDEARDMALTNLFGTWLVSRQVGIGMARRHRGAIVNIGSIFARQCPAGSAMYAATKAGIEAMTSAMAKELATFGVTVNCIGLSPYDTESMRATGTPEKIAASIAALTPPRLVTTEEVARTILGLVGNPMLTGQTVYLGGVR